MKGLLIKDFLNQRGQMKIYIIIIGFFFLITLFSNSNNIAGIGGYICILCTLLPINAIAYDERCSWDRYALSMPISRKDLVISKYLFLLITSLIGVSLNFILCLIKGFLSLETLTILLVFWSLSIILTSLILPIIIKLGTEKGRMAMMAIILCPTLLILLAAKLQLPMPNSHLLDQLSTLAPILIPILIPIATILILFISIGISLKIYNKKEL